MNGIPATTSFTYCKNTIDLRLLPAPCGVRIRIRPLRRGVARSDPDRHSRLGSKDLWI